MAKRAAKKAETDAEAESPTGDVGMRTLRAGTVVLLPASGTLLRLETDVPVSGDRIDRNAKFVGMLSRNQNNWDLNIDQVEGTWNPITCRREDGPSEIEE